MLYVKRLQADKCYQFKFEFKILLDRKILFRTDKYSELRWSWKSLYRVKSCVAQQTIGGISGNDPRLDGTRKTKSQQKQPQWLKFTVKLYCKFLYKTFLFSSLGTDSCWWFVLSAITLRCSKISTEFQTQAIENIWQWKSFRPQNASTFRKVQRSIFWSTDCISPTRWWT